MIMLGSRYSANITGLLGDAPLAKPDEHAVTMARSSPDFSHFAMLYRAARDMR